MCVACSLKRRDDGEQWSYLEDECCADRHWRLSWSRCSATAVSVESHQSSSHLLQISALQQAYDELCASRGAAAVPYFLLKYSDDGVQMAPLSDWDAFFKDGRKVLSSFFIFQQNACECFFSWRLWFTLSPGYSGRVRSVHFAAASRLAFEKPAAPLVTPMVFRLFCSTLACHLIPLASETFGLCLRIWRWRNKNKQEDSRCLATLVQVRLQWTSAAASRLHLTPGR